MQALHAPSVTSSLTGLGRRAARLARQLLLPMLALAGHAFWQPALAADDFLDPDKAFQFSARPLDAKTIEVTFDIAPGYYLYRDQFRFTAKDATLGTPVIPPGKTKFDETFQKTVETYRNSVKISVPVEGASGTFRFVTTSQGCADAGLCYPPQRAAAMVSLAGFGGTGSVQPAPAEDAGTNGSDLAATSASPTAAAALTTAAATTAVRPPTTAAARGDAGAIESVLRSGAFWPIVGAFFVAGLLLSLTPCVLPMLPIISSIIVGQGGYGGGALAGVPGTVTTPVSRARGFTLAASYSFGMAIVYTAFGVAAGLAGEGLSAALQNPWVLGAFAVGLVVLALSMFGVYELQLPDALVGRFNTAAQRMPAGRVAGVCAMGGVSALIVSPCVAAPLAGALLYLSQTRDVWLGGTALFSLAAGMSVPLLLVGASAGALLPRAGAWMVEVKMAFGVLLVGVALWTVQPVMPAPMAVACWGLLAFGAAALTMARGRSTGRSTTSAAAAVTAARPVSHATWRYAVAGVLGIVGLLEIVGAAAGGDDPLQPLARLTTHGDRTASTAAAGPTFAPVKSVDELDAVLRHAGRPVVLDFYADWCVSCKEMERFVFTDPAVQKRLSGALLLRADVTANGAEDRALLRRFHLFGPPTTIFFDAQGNEIEPARLIGYQNTERFLQTLGSAGL